MGRNPQTDRAAIIEASVRLADEKGLPALTMHAVAREVGVSATALYRHVHSKQDLLDGVVEALLTELPLPPEDLHWQERLIVLADAIRASAQRHPEAFVLLLQRPARTDGSLRVREAVYRALREAGIPDPLVARVERLLSTFVLGFALSEAGGRFTAGTADVDADFAAAGEIIVAVLAAITPPSRVDPGAAAPAR